MDQSRSVGISNFHLILPSNSCPNTQPDNKANKFLVDYENNIDLPGNWEAALTEFTCFYAPKKLTGNHKVVYKEKQFRTEYYILKIYYKSKKWTYSVSTPKQINDGKIIQENYVKLPKSIAPVKLNFGTYISLEANKKYVMQAFFTNEGIANIFGFMDERDFSDTGKLVADDEFDISKLDVKSKYEIRVELENRLIDKTVTLQMTNKDNANQVVAFLRNKSPFKSIMFNNSGYIEFKLLDKIVNMKFNKELASILGFDKTVFEIGDKGTLKPIRDKNESNHVFIYSSLIEPVFVGGLRAPLLKSFMIDNKYKYGDTINYVVENPMYIPISSTSINNIEVNIRDDSGRPINFVYGTKTNLVIHLRRVQ